MAYAESVDEHVSSAPEPIEQLGIRDGARDPGVGILAETSLQSSLEKKESAATRLWDRALPIPHHGEANVVPHGSEAGRPTPSLMMRATLSSRVWWSAFTRCRMRLLPSRNLRATNLAYRLPATLGPHPCDSAQRASTQWLPVGQTVPSEGCIPFAMDRDPAHRRQQLKTGVAHEASCIQTQHGVRVAVRRGLETTKQSSTR